MDEVLMELRPSDAEELAELNESRDFVIVEVASDGALERILEVGAVDAVEEEPRRLVDEANVFETFDECAEYISSEYSQPEEGMIRPYGAEFLKTAIAIRDISDVELVS